MIIEPADVDDLAVLARLVWQNHYGEPPDEPVDAFEADLGRWWAEHRDTHAAFVARDPDAGVVGMAWVALFARVPRPGTLTRTIADVQSVFVLPEHRGRGIGSALVEAASANAQQRGAGGVVVHSGNRAVPVYERLGFASSRRLLVRPPD